MKGRRLDDAPFGSFPIPYDDLQPGDYWRVLDHLGEPCTPDTYPSTATAEQKAGNLTGGVWGFIDPLGNYGVLSIHTVREEDDGTISVRPGDGSSNSIKCSKGNGINEWHGYIEHGEWNAC